MKIDRLKEVIPRLKALMNHYKDSSLSHRVNYDYEQATELLRGMEAAAEANEALIFC